MNLLFSFSGRIGRGKFWLGVLSYLVLAILTTLVIGYIFPPTDFLIVNIDSAGTEGMPTYNFGSPYFIASMVASIPLMWISLAIAVKRMHDRGRSGWWVLPMFLLMLFLIGFIWWLVDLGILEGEEGTNRWGPNPVPSKD